MNNRISVATINSPEFVNLQAIDVNPLMSKCDIKVMYVGQNRNRSTISKQVATEMSKTLRGCPIVGYYIDSKEDFGDHGEQMIIDGEGIKFNKLTKPYGFVSPDAKVWFQFFEDQDEYGNTVVREYLMTEGYLWTGQFEECKRVIENNNPQSMELDNKTLKGFWSNDNNKGVDFFIINDATFSSLCILGEDVEPCFEGAQLSAPKMSSSFSKDDDFTKSLFTMMEELKFALTNNKGGQPMHDEIENVVDTTVETTFENQENVEAPASEYENTVEGETSEFSNEEVPAETSESTDFAKKDEEEEKDEEKKDSQDKTDKNDKENSEDNTEDEDKKKKCFALEQALEELQSKYSALEAEYNDLLAFKNEVENGKKDELIASFYMLSDEDKKEVVENKANFSLEEIEAKLSVICFRNKVSFAETESEEQPATVFNLNAVLPQDNTPEWVQAVKANMNK